MTYYKLNRERLEDFYENIDEFVKDRLSYLILQGILEEVQEEEVAKEYAGKQIMQDVEADLVQGDGTGKVKPSTHLYEETTLAKSTVEHFTSSKPFLDGQKPSEVLAREFESKSDVDRQYGVAVRVVIGEMFDLLVEELKRTGTIK